MTNILRSCIIKLAEANVRNTNQLRCYARWSHRRPRRVLSPEEYEETENKNVSKLMEKDTENVTELNPEIDVLPKIKETSSKWVPENLKSDLSEVIQRNEVKLKEKQKKKSMQYKDIKIAPKNATDMLQTIIDSDGNFIFTKLNDNDPVISKLMITVKLKKEQIAQDLALLEGRRLIKEALEAKCILKNLIFSRKSDIEFLKPYLPKSGATLYKIPYREIQLWSDLTTSPGIMGIFKIPDVSKFVSKNCLPLTIICDNVREPGNLGAILRTAAGVGAQNIILTKGCVDLWDRKVLRSACGAHFCLQIHKQMEWSDVRKHIENNASTVLIADNKVVTETVDNSNSENNLEHIISNVPLLPYYGVQFSNLNSITLVVGGETHGISKEIYELASEFNGIRLNIPLNNNVDSLNTGIALGIIIFEIKKQMLISGHIHDEIVSVNNN